MEKKLLLSLLLLIFQAFSIERITLPENDFTISTSGGETSFSGGETFGLPGQPDLPVSYLKILVSPNADLKTVKVNLEDIEETEIAGSFRVKKVSLPKTTSGIVYKVKSSTYRNGRDESIYSIDALFPKNCIRSVMVGQLQAFKIVDIAIQRLKYNPVSGKLVELKKAVVVVDYNEERGVGDFYSSVYDDAASIVNTIVKNKDKISTYNSYRKRAIGDYVVITTSSFKNNSRFLPQFVNLKRNDGFNVKVITESDWGGGSGAAAVNNIRNWLISNEPEYVFIIGDPSKGSAIPMVEGPHASVKIPLTDFCYADLNGAYGFDGDSRFYEYANEGITKTRFDQYPEINVGRLPIYNGNISDAEKLLERMIEYMTESASFAESYRLSAFLPLNTFNDSQNGICFGEEVRTRILDPNGYTYERIYYNHAGTTANYPCSYDSTVSIWNRGKFGLMCLQGHGLVNMAEKAIDNAHVAELTTDGFVHGFNISCNNGRPQDPTNLGFAIMKKAGISQIASAVEIWYSTSSISNYGTGATGNDYAFSYMDNLVNFKKGAGACFTKTRASQNLSSDNDWQNHCELNLYGCPAIGLYTYGISDQVNVLQQNNTDQNKTITSTISGSGIVKFKSSVNFNKNSSVEIFDSRGKVVDRIKSIKDNEFIWNSKEAGISKGIYYAKFSKNKNEFATVKLMLK